MFVLLDHSKYNPYLIMNIKYLLLFVPLLFSGCIVSKKVTNANPIELVLKSQNPKIMEAIVLYVTKTLMKLNKPEIRLACQCHCLVAMSFVPVAGKGFYPKK
jgi:hypothetical protein